MKKIFLVCSLGGLALSAGSTNASTIAYDNAAGVAGLQHFGGSLSLDFNVISPISVNALGVFDNGVLGSLDGVGTGTGPGAGGVGTGVEIVDLSTGLPVPGLGEVPFSSASPGVQINGDNFKAITPVLLPVGSYTVTAFNTDNYNSFGGANASSTTNSSSGAGVISFVGSGRWDNARADVPSHGDGGPANRYDAGTFEFTPEPAMLGMLGFAGVGLLTRRRRS